MTRRLCIFFVLSLLAVSVRAQQTTISYQGAIANSNGAPADSGTYSITVSFYSDESGTQPLWNDTFETMIRKGIFNIALGSGRLLPPPSVFDRPIWVGTRIGGMAESRPLSRLSAVPMSMNVADSSITSAKLNADYISSISVNGEKVTGKATNLNIVGNVVYDEASKSLMLNGSSNSANGKGASTETANGTVYWGEKGNWNVNPDSNHFLGTIGDTAFEIHIDNIGNDTQGRRRVVRYEPNDLSPNIIAGFNGNSISGGAIGGVISGGGYYGKSNSITGIELATIGGGDNNSVSGRIGTIAGGENGNVISEGATVGGGYGNTAGAASMSEKYQTVSGGLENTASGDDAAIGGGENNQATAYESGVASGSHNTANGTRAFVGGGATNFASGDSSAVLGGSANNATGFLSSILGGYNNYATGVNSAVIGGRKMDVGDSSFGYNASTSPSVTDLHLFHSVAYLGDVDLWIGNVDDSARGIRFYAPNHNFLYTTGSHYNSFRSDTQSVDIEYILPCVSPIAGQVLKAATVSGSSVGLSWATDTGGGGLSGWLLSGNSGTTAGTNYLGTNDNEAFEIHIDNSDVDTAAGDHRVMRYEVGNTSPNIIGGSKYNADGGVGYEGAAILSGGNHFAPNILKANFSVVVGGAGNLIDDGSGYSSAGWDYTGVGLYDTIDDPDAIGACWVNDIYGGSNNKIRSTWGAIIGGGEFNVIDSLSILSLIVGGAENSIHNNTNYAVITGGLGNMIDAGASYSALAGGDSNIVAAELSFLGGGGVNKIMSPYSVLVGGIGNTISNNGSIPALGRANFIGGGENNTIDGQGFNAPDDPAEASAIVAGSGNAVHEFASFVGAGENDTASDDRDFIGAGLHNILAEGTENAIVAGVNNAIAINGDQGHGSAFIGAGNNNYITLQGVDAAIPAGDHLTAQSYTQTVLGHYNVQQGTSQSDTSRNPDDFLLIIGNGNQLTGRSNAFTVSDTGYASCYAAQGTGTRAGSAGSSRLGTIYANNTIEAWANVPATAPGDTAATNIGVQSVHWTGLPNNLYQVQLNVRNQDGTAFAYDTSHCSIVATITHQGLTGSPGIIEVSPISTTGSFTVITWNLSPAQVSTFGFMFHVIVQKQ